MPSYIVMGAMKGRFYSQDGNTYDNFQMMGYVEAADSREAVSLFFEQPAFPLRWSDVEYMWAERLADDPDNGHHGEFHRVYTESLQRLFRGPGPT